MIKSMPYGLRPQLPIQMRNSRSLHIWYLHIHTYILVTHIHVSTVFYKHLPIFPWQLSAPLSNEPLAQRSRVQDITGMRLGLCAHALADLVAKLPWEG